MISPLTVSLLIGLGGIMQYLLHGLAVRGDWDEAETVSVTPWADFM